MKVYSPKYPQLVVNDLKVTFVKGVAEVTNKTTLNKLAAMKAFGFTFEDVKDVPPVPPMPPTGDEGDAGADGIGEADIPEGEDD